MSMGIKEDIFEEFFKKLAEDKEIADAVLGELKELWKKGEVAPKEKILEVIERGCGNACED
jgi:hypothetical protein